MTDYGGGGGGEYFYDGPAKVAAEWGLKLSKLFFEDKEFAKLKACR